MGFKEFSDSLSKNQKYLLGFYAFSMVLLFLTQFLISKQEARIEGLRELNKETWTV